MARSEKDSEGGIGGSDATVRSLRYPAKRKNIPPAGLEAHGVVKNVPAMHRAYNPHLTPELKSPRDAFRADLRASQVQQIIAASRDRKLEDDEADILMDAVRQHEPWLEWSGKREKPWFVVDPVALHMHERVSTQAILRAMERRDIQRDLFADPQHDYSKAVQFYQHDVDWTNRMILGDSLQVMASLAGRENLTGRVQMIYFDPPYGIKFRSNFQPNLGQYDVGDRVQDLTREPEMVHAYRDTWTLGVHSYLTYLRDRLAMARELLHETGSIFVQISDHNLHRVRCVMDEIFGASNFVVTIKFSKTAGLGGRYLDETFDQIIWFAKNIKSLKFRQLFIEPKAGTRGATQYQLWMDRNGHITRSNSELDARVFAHDNLTSQTGGESTIFPIEFNGQTIRKPKKGGWKSSHIGIERLKGANRVMRVGNSLRYIRFFDDAPYYPMGSGWTDTGISGFASQKAYVVQTLPLVIQRCMLMTTDPGDLVIDPTCGSGTTAYVAEQWGRRWITIDTSRVALTVAKHRLLVSTFDYYELRRTGANDESRNPEGTWITALNGKHSGSRCTFLCKVVPHVTLSSITRNSSLDPIIARHEKVLLGLLSELNGSLSHVSDDTKKALVTKLIEKHRQLGVQGVSDADIRRWLLPGTNPEWITPIRARHPLKAVTDRQVDKYRGLIPEAKWQDWQVPFDIDSDWPEILKESVCAYRLAWRTKMDEVNACIGTNAECVEFVDQPQIVNGVVRVAGPFTMEGVIAVEDGMDSPNIGAPVGIGSSDPNDVGSSMIENSEAHADKIIRLLKVSGVDFPGNERMRFKYLEPVQGVALVHAEGDWLNGSDEGRRVAVSIGPEVGNVSSRQIEESVRSANKLGYDDVVYAGFGFDAQAQDAIEHGRHPHLQLHMALIRPDVSMEDLLKTQPGSQMFTVFSAPRVMGPFKQDDGMFVVEIEGMDVYDPVSNALFPTTKDGIAAWFVDTCYDGRTFCICQAFFPDRGKWDKLAKALRSVGAFDASVFDALCGYRSLPFSAPPKGIVDKTWKIAVKVVDARGNEGLRVVDGGVSQ